MAQKEYRISQLWSLWKGNLDEFNTWICHSTRFDVGDVIRRFELMMGNVQCELEEDNHYMIRSIVIFMVLCEKFRNSHFIIDITGLDRPLKIDSNVVIMGILY